jgi:ADP-heptose:LPS heptosyltransferase
VLPDRPAPPPAPGPAAPSPPAPAEPARTGPTRAEQLAAQARLGGGVKRGPVGDLLRAVGRALALGLANLAFPRPRAGLPPLAEIRKVLVVRVDERVGNQLLTTPLVRALKLGLPGAELHLLAPRQGQLVGSPHVDRAITWQKRDAFRAPLRFLGLLRDLRRARYDLVVEAGHWSAYSLTASLLARLVAGRAPIVGHDRGDAARFLSHPVPHDPSEEGEVPAKLELLRPLGLPARGLELDTSLGLDRSDAAAELLERAGLAGKALAVVNPGARFADRRWPPEAYAAVCRGLVARGLAPLVVWGPGEEPLARAIAEGSGAALAPPTDLPLLAALLRRARLVVSNNSGPMHLGVAVGASTVGVFFRGDSARWGHRLAGFAAAEVRGEDEAEVVLAACDRALGRRTSTA